VSSLATLEPKTSELERWERRVHLGAHPVLYPLIRGLGYRRPVQRIPGLGILVSEAGLLREVLMTLRALIDWYLEFAGVHPRRESNLRQRRLSRCDSARGRCGERRLN